MADGDAPTAPLPESIGRYQVARLLGEGAMGRVLLAHDPVLDRDVAIKHLRADLNIPDDVRRGLLKRMRHEARAAARVMHPHLVTLHDMGEDDRVGLYLVFEYVEGPTLKERVARGRMLPSEAARTAIELGTALTTAHDAGILHRDIKPENVILSKKGGKIADFGIARIPDSTLTHQGGLMGTPAYSAPETFRTSTFSPESDQFSLAATLYEAVSGQRAFPGDDAVAVAQRILHETIEPFASKIDLSEEVDRVFSRALSRRPRERFSSCEAFGRALADALTAPPGGAAASGSSGSDREATTSKSAGPSRAASAGGSTPDAARLPAANEGLPRDRRSSHIVLGIIAVAVTGLLLVRTALKGADDVPPAPSSSASAVAPAASSSAPRPKSGPGSSSRPSRASSPTGTVALTDAGAPSPSESGAPDAPTPSGTAESSTSTGTTSPSAEISEPPASPTSSPATPPKEAGPAEPPDAGR